MNGIAVGVLRGGPSREHEVSLATGAAVLANLSPERFLPRDIYIDRAGAWYDRGRPSTPLRALRALDAAVVALHGEYGEDGEVQKVLERFGVPYTGSDAFASFLATHKLLAKERAREAGLLVPAYLFAEDARDAAGVARDAVRSFLQPIVVKPVNWGSSVGVSIVGGYEPVLRAISGLFGQGAAAVLVEERILGTEAAAGVIENFRGERLYALPPVENNEICPGRFSRVVAEELGRAAKVMHRALGLRHYSCSDFVVSPRGTVYYLETNALPGLTEGSLFPKALAAVGVSLSDFFGHLVDSALAG